MGRVVARVSESEASKRKRKGHIGSALDIVWDGAFKNRGVKIRGR